MTEKKKPSLDRALTVRFPSDLYERMQRVASSDMRSLNALILIAISQYVKEKEPTNENR